MGVAVNVAIKFAGVTVPLYKFTPALKFRVLPPVPCAIVIVALPPTQIVLAVIEILPSVKYAYAVSCDVSPTALNLNESPGQLQTVHVVTKCPLSSVSTVH